MRKQIKVWLPAWLDWHGESEDPDEEATEPDVPTRVVKRVTWNATRAIYGLPEKWKGQDVTCILGKDELPEEVAEAFLRLTGELLEIKKPTDWPELQRFIRSRWPEAFKP